MYIWELPDWPEFRWDRDRLLPALQKAHLKQGRLLGRMERLGFDLRLEAELQAIAAEAIKTSEIEGENLDPAAVRSSVARRLGIPQAALGREDRRVEGVVEMTLDATKNFAHSVPPERLFGWQAALFPTGFSGTKRIKVGAWRDGPVGVYPAQHGEGLPYFEGPPADRVPGEMDSFLEWYNRPQEVDGIVHAAIAHLWFVTIHPFEDGNGRVARALADMSLARSENSSQRFYSLSAEIRRERPAYYASLEAAQKGELEITQRLLWFADCFTKALDAAEKSCSSVLRKADFWQKHVLVELNERQRRVLNRFLDGFDGKLTAVKWSRIAKCSIATAQRDIKELTELGVLLRNAGGSKNTSYSVAGFDSEADG